MPAALFLAIAALLCCCGAAAAKQPRIPARAWAVIDARTGTVLASHAGRRHLPIASTTKLMTAYLALHELPLRRIVRAAPYTPIYGESLLGLRTGQRVSVRDLLYGLILRSGNDAAYNLALAAAGSERRFVRQMNRRAAALGLADTHYANPIGLDQRGNFSSALDLTTLARRLMRIPVFRRIADSRHATLRSMHPLRRIETINHLLDDGNWLNGIKTGHTFAAKYVLVGAGRRHGVELISALIGAPSDADRDEGTVRLLDYGFSRYTHRVPIHAGDDLADPVIRYTGGELPLRAAHSVHVGLRRNQRVRLAIQAPSRVEGPIRRGAVIGRATVLVAGRRAGSTPLRASRSIAAAGAFDRIRSFLGRYGSLIGTLAFVILIGASVLWRLRRRRRGGGGVDVVREQRRPTVHEDGGDREGSLVE